MVSRKTSVSANYQKYYILNMSIKHLKPRSSRKKGPKQGYYDVSRSAKYVQKDNEPCIYRSSYEYKFMYWCENNDNVKTWSSEPSAVNYICLETGKTRKYWLDFAITTANDEVWIIEVKPLREVNEAKAFGAKFRQLTNESEKKRLVLANKVASKNWSKWQHAKRQCDDKGYKFKLVTENFLNNR